METFEAIRTVLAVRQFKETPIPEPIVRQIVEAGRLTASSMNGQPWHFIIVQDKETLRQLGSLAPTGPYIAQAPLAIIVGIEHSPYAVSDASRAIQSMILAAWSQPFRIKSRVSHLSRGCGPQSCRTRHIRCPPRWCARSCARRAVGR